MENQCAGSPVDLGEPKALPLDDILSRTGVAGTLQLLIHFSVFYVELVVTGHIGLVFFTGHSPPWRCVDNTTSGFCNNNHNTEFSMDSPMFNARCNLNRSDWTYLTHKYYSFVTEYDLVCGETSKAALVGIAYFVGTVAGNFVCGPLGDFYGRKQCIILSSLMLIGASIGIKCSGSLGQLYFLEFFSGLATIGTQITDFIYLTEYSPPKFRATASNIIILCQCCGFMLMAMFAYFLQNWRSLSFYLILLVLPFLAVFVFLPESARWLLSKNKVDKAEIILSNIVQFKGGIKVRVLKERSETAHSTSHTYWDIFRKLDVLVFTMRIISLWMVLNVLYYTIAAQSLNYSGDMYVNYLLVSIWDIPAFFLVSYATDKIGRKKTTLIGCFISGLLVSVVPAIPKYFVYRYAFTMFFTAAGRFCCSAAFYGLYLWTSELFPTVLRAQGMCICGTFEKIAMLVVPLICTLLQTVSYRLPFILMGVMGVGGSFVALPLPETKGQPTRENYEDFFPKKPDTVENEMGVDNIGSTEI